MKSIERKQFLFDVFVTALEGSINYFAYVESYKCLSEQNEELVDGFFAIISDAEATTDASMFPEEEFEFDFKDLKIDEKIIAKGINKIVKNGIKINPTLKENIIQANRTNDAGKIDGDCADCIVQVGLFNKIVYG